MLAQGHSRAFTDVAVISSAIVDKLNAGLLDVIIERALEAFAPEYPGGCASALARNQQSDERAGHNACESNAFSIFERSKNAPRRRHGYYFSMRFELSHFLILSRHPRFSVA